MVADNAQDADATDDPLRSARDAPDGWPTPSAQAKAIIRRGAEQAMTPPEHWVQGLQGAILSGVRMLPIAEDPVLADGVRDTNLINTMTWVAANVVRPGQRVPVNLPTEVLGTARDLVRRGLDESALDSFRTAQSLAWRLWMDICFDLTDDVGLLREVFAVTSLSISTYIDDTVAAMSARMQAERDDLTRGTHAQRRQTVALLLEGAPIPTSRAESQLGYRLSGPHTAAIVWATGPDPAAELEAVADAITRTAGLDARLTVVASAASWWIWLPTDGVQIAADSLAAHPGVRVAVGRPGRGVEGFRAGHFQALAAQRLLAGIGGPHAGERGPQVVHYDEIRLTALLTADPTALDDFVTDTLGDLVGGGEELLSTLRTWISLQCNTSRTAEVMYSHRNTVIRRLARADELLPRPLAENFVDVAACLEVTRWRD